MDWGDSPHSGRLVHKKAAISETWQINIKGHKIIPVRGGCTLQACPVLDRSPIYGTWLHWRVSPWLLASQTAFVHFYCIWNLVIKRQHLQPPTYSHTPTHTHTPPPNFYPFPPNGLKNWHALESQWVIIFVKSSDTRYSPLTGTHYTSLEESCNEAHAHMHPVHVTRHTHTRNASSFFSPFLLFLSYAHTQKHGLISTHIYTHRSMSRNPNTVCLW